MQLDWPGAPLSGADRVLCAYAMKARLRLQDRGGDDLVPLRAVGLSDAAIHDATQVIAFLTDINRVADCLGIDLEPEMGKRPAGW